MTDLDRKPVPAPIVAAARIVMAHGASMQEAAVQLGVRSSELDLSLWRHIGTPTGELLAEKRKRRWRADFD